MVKGKERRDVVFLFLAVLLFLCAEKMVMMDAKSWGTGRRPPEL